MTALGDFQHQREIGSGLCLAPDGTHDDLVVQRVTLWRFDFDAALFGEHFENLMCGFNDELCFFAVHGLVYLLVSDPVTSAANQKTLGVSYE